MHPLWLWTSWSHSLPKELEGGGGNKEAMRKSQTPGNDQMLCTNHEKGSWRTTQHHIVGASSLPRKGMFIGEVC